MRVYASKPVKTSHPGLHTLRKDLSPGPEIRGQALEVDLALCHTEQEKERESLRGVFIMAFCFN